VGAIPTLAVHFSLLILSETLDLVFGKFHVWDLETPKHGADQLHPKVGFQKKKFTVWIRQKIQEPLNREHVDTHFRQTNGFKPTVVSVFLKQLKDIH